MGKVEFCALGSGSKGNSFALKYGTKVMLVDAGFSRKEMLHRLELCGLDPAEILGVLLTHEHNDHVKGCRVLCNALEIPLYCSGRTAGYLQKKNELPEKVTCFEPGDHFCIEDFDVNPFPVQHDAIDPVGFVIGCGTLKIGIATDLGEVNHLGRVRLRGCDALVLESNYDREMLYQSDRDLFLKRRINGRNGHLGNMDCAAALPELLSDMTKLLMLVHVSSECNTYDLVQSIGSEILHKSGRDRVQLTVARQDAPTPLFHLEHEEK